MHTSASRHWCINIQPCLPTNPVNVSFSKKDLSTHENYQYYHPPLAFLNIVLSVFNEKDDEFLNILEKYSNCFSVCKRFKPTPPKPAVGYLFYPDKMKFNQVVSINLK